MRIVYIIHSLNNCGGIERVVTIKANYLTEEMGHEVWIITGRMKQRKLAFPLSGKVHRLDLGVNDRNFISFRRLRKTLDHALRTIQPDITVSVGGNDIFVLPDCTDGSIKIAEYHFPHDKYLKKYGNTFYARFRTRVLEKAASRLRAFVVLTRKDQARWATVLPQVHQIYNPLTFYPERTASLERPACMAVGRLEPEKNFQDLITAWKAVASLHPDWTLDIFGSGHLENRLKRQIRKARLEGKVRLRGHSDRIREELVTHSCIVMSSRYEGFPMILLEAASCGVPLVSYDCPCGPSEIIDDGSNGYLVPTGETALLAERICLALEKRNPGMGQAARWKAEAFRPEVIMKEWENFFRSLL